VTERLARSGLWVERSSLISVRPLIESGHYLGKVRSRGRFAYALVSGDPWEFVGAAVFGQPARETVAVSLWKDTDPAFAMAATLELTRFYTIDGLLPNTGTWFLSRAVRLLRQDAPGIEMLVAFSDEDAGHHGGLYQAASWRYTGTSQSDHYHYEDKDGNRVAKQTPWKNALRQRQADPVKYAGERPVDGERRVAVANGWTKVKDRPKHRYVLPLTHRARKRLKLAEVGYPKPDE
jgi:hypothetical protein